MKNPTNPDMDQDLDLITRTAEGEREAFNELVLKYQKPLYSLLYRMVSNHEDTADLLQKTFVKAFTGLVGFERRSSFKTWLYQIAINLAKNVYRDRSRAEHVNIDDVVIRRNPRTVETLIAKEARQQLKEALTGLPEKQRMTLLLRIQEDKKFEEIAEIMKCSTGTAKANYHHAVQKLKKIMGEGIQKTEPLSPRSRHE
jgi:RNA polymerase sigma-70 factor (ECF subfamily)